MKVETSGRENMKLRDAITTLKRETMACWWPNGSYPGKQGTDFEGIFGEIRTLQQGIRDRQGIPADAMFYTLDEDSPETALHDELNDAYVTVIRSMQKNA